MLSPDNNSCQRSTLYVDEFIKSQHQSRWNQANECAKDAGSRNDTKILIFEYNRRLD